MRTRPLLLSPAAALLSTLGVIGLCVVTAGADVIRLVPDSTVKAPGGQINGQIKSESPTEVVIKAAVGGEQKVPVDQIESVSYDGPTPSYTLAESRENAGSIAEAADLFEKAVAEARDKPLIQRSAQFHRARLLAELAQADPGKTDEAMQALEAYLKAQPNSRQVGQALESLVRLALQKGDTARAESALKDLTAKVPGAADRAAILQARLQGRQGKHDQAIATLDKLASAAPKGSARAREALLAKAESLAATKQFSEAEQAVREVIAQAPPEADAVQSQAYNTLGDCLRAAGRPKDALLAYLRVDVLYDRDKEQHARALSQIAQLWRTLKQDARADEVQERLRTLYPKSPYASARAVAPR